MPRPATRPDNRNAGAQWYVARTQPCKEAIAEINLGNQGVRTFLPRFWKTLRRFKSFEDKLRPLFPGYIFFHSARDPALWRSISGTLGVSHVVWGDGRQPRPVPDAFMAELLSACDAGVMTRVTTGLEVGARVQINRGPFSNVLATITGLSDAGRITLFMDIMGGITAKMHANEMERVA